MADARDMYTYYKRKYNNSVSQKKASERRESEYVAGRKKSDDDLKASKKERTNLERRLEGVKKIIGMMTGTGGIWDKDVPNSILKSNKSSVKSGSNYSDCIRCGGVANADVAQKFHSESVESDIRSSGALNAFEQEARRLENTIAEIERQINLLENKIDEFTSQIKRCNNEQSELRRNINRYSSEMRYYKRRMNATS